jgi:hypothetical protein
VSKVPCRACRSRGSCVELGDGNLGCWWISVQELSHEARSAGVAVWRWGPVAVLYSTLTNFRLGTSSVGSMLGAQHLDSFRNTDTRSPCSRGINTVFRSLTPIIPSSPWHAAAPPSLLLQIPLIIANPRSCSSSSNTTTSSSNPS